jgi:hypothetical protein
MTCPNCDFFPELQEIRSPAQLRSILKKIQFAVASGQLKPEGVEDDNAQQKSQGCYEDLIIEGAWPDILDFFFLCATCGQRFHLFCDTCHGSGGEWSRV